jgi:excisionase family DNA binding protein
MEARVISLLNDIKLLLTNKETSDKWLDIKGASEYCSLSPMTLRRNVWSGKLKASKVTGKMLFKRSELETFLG